MSCHKPMTESVPFCPFLFSWSPISANPGLTLIKTYGVIPRLALMNNRALIYSKSTVDVIKLKVPGEMLYIII